MTTAEIIGRVRNALDKPLGNHPDDVQLRQVVLEEAQHYMNRIRISNRRGNTQQGSFGLFRDNERSQIAESGAGFGTWVYAEVIDPLRPWNRPPVRLIDAQDFDQFPMDVTSVAYPPGVIYGALTSEDGAVIFRRRTPIGADFECFLLYEQGALTSLGEAQIDLPAHHNYLLAKCVLKALTRARWDQPDKVKYGSDMSYTTWFDRREKERRQELAAPYLLNLDEMRATFELDCRSPQEPPVMTTSSGVYMEDLWAQF